MTRVLYEHLEAVPPEQWAFLAGLFLGEGCFSVGDKWGVPTFELKVALCDRAVVEWLQQVFGGRVSPAGREGRGDRLQAAFAWRIEDGFLAVAIVERILPYMRGDKAEQGQAFLRFAHRKLEVWQQRQAEGRRQYLPSERLELYRLALSAREYAGGNGKRWMERWSATIYALGQQCGTP